ncbi:hypothetical protein N7492_004363 [Penicillium capsulatum]|uniref:Uncharacterized protein n=1 Tax=Penicillium capsulatum TaxID=69766 RepID=A0A9W9IAB6_9EURO|nr:hypothetical protein N7492_004363 [Penicillium capsulatum]KAJ6136518.1 hypothetical protein N7512_001678 [Penicillium capsulatum]
MAKMMDAEKRNNDRPNSSDKTAKKDTTTKKNTTTTQTSQTTRSSDPEEVLATQATVAGPISLLPQHIHLQDQNPKRHGWGPAGSIWRFILGDGAKFIMKAACQGSGCTNINGKHSKKMSAGI